MFSHVQINCADLEASRRFYLDVLAPLGFTEADSLPGEYTRLTNGRDAVLVLCPVEPRFQGQRQHRKLSGVHHLALAVGSDPPPAVGGGRWPKAGGGSSEAENGPPPPLRGTSPRSSRPACGRRTVRHRNAKGNSDAPQ